MEVVGGGGGSTLAVERAAVNCFREVNKVSSPRQSAGQWDDIRGHRLRTPKPNSYSGYSSRIPPICRFLLDDSPLPSPPENLQFFTRTTVSYLSIHLDPRSLLSFPTSPRLPLSAIRTQFIEEFSSPPTRLHSIKSK